MKKKGRNADFNSGPPEEYQAGRPIIQQPEIAAIAWSGSVEDNGTTQAHFADALTCWQRQDLQNGFYGLVRICFQAHASLIRMSCVP